MCDGKESPGADQKIGTAGLGRATIVRLAAHGSPKILFTGRNETSAQETIKCAQEVNLESSIAFVKCDMSDLTDVKAAATQISQSTDRLDIVFCNAGVMAIPAGLSKDGYENQFATNHLAHAMLLRQLRPLLRRTAAMPGSDVRIISNSSIGYMFASEIKYDTLRTKQESMIFGAFRRYGQSKLANILYASELARQLPSMLSVAIHPGVINTGLVTGLSAFNYYFTQMTTFWQQVTVEEGVKNQLWAATAPKDAIVNGAFYEPVGKLGRMSAAAQSEEAARELYAWTEEELSKY